MADTVTRARRSRVMARVRREHTPAELAVRRAIWASGLRGWRTQARELPGRPDLVFRRARVAIFVDGAFWHGHPSRYPAGRARSYWRERIARTVERDRRVTATLRRQGWSVVRVWDFDALGDPARAARRIARLVARRTITAAARSRAGATVAGCARPRSRSALVSPHRARTSVPAGSVRRPASRTPRARPRTSP